LVVVIVVFVAGVHNDGGSGGGIFNVADCLSVDFAFDFSGVRGESGGEGDGQYDTPSSEHEFVEDDNNNTAAASS